MNNSPLAGDSDEKRVLFLSGELALGGAAMFVMNVCDELRDTDEGWLGIAGVFFNLGKSAGRCGIAGLRS